MRPFAPLVLVLVGLNGCAGHGPAHPPTADGTWLTGRVVAEDGTPIGGAAVTASRSGGDLGFQIVGQAVTDASGAFRLVGLEPGPVHLSAASTGHAPQAQCDRTVGPDSEATVPDFVLQDGGVPVSGEVANSAGAAIARAHLVVTPFTPTNGPAACGAIALPADADGAYAGRVDAGLKAFFGRAPGHVDAIAVEMVSEARAFDYRLDPAAEVAPAPDAVVDWVRGARIPLTGVEPGSDPADLAGLDALVADARVIALGESTHGTREFFQLKHRLLEYLVAEHGVTAFAIEAAMPEAFELNRYVLTGEGDPRRALAALYFWTWDTEEVLALVEWMRQYNATHERPIRFYGMDVQSGGWAFERVSAFLTDQGVMPEVHELQPLARARSARQLEPGAVQAAEALVAAFDQHRDALIAASSEAEFDELRQCAVVIGQHAAFVTRQRPRDASMADNVRWVLDREDKVVVWAHNAHVSAEPGSGTLGDGLRQALGDDLRTVGFEFGSGGFRAIPFPFWKRLGVQDLSVPALDDESLPAMLARADSDTFALDLRAVPADGEVRDWFAAMRPAHAIGAGFPPGSPGYGPAAQLAVRQYDALIFVRESHPTRPNPTGVPPARQVHGDAGWDVDAMPLGGLPVGWTWNPQHAALGYAAEVVACGDGQCLRLGRSEEGRIGQGVALLTRRVVLDGAQPGTSIRVQARVRGEGEGTVEVRLEGSEDQRFEMLGRAASDPFEPGAWRDVDLQVPVPQGAAFAVVELGFEGEGAMRVGAVTLTTESMGDADPQ